MIGWNAQFNLTVFDVHYVFLFNKVLFVYHCSIYVLTYFSNHQYDAKKSIAVHI